MQQFSEASSKCAYNADVSCLFNLMFSYDIGSEFQKLLSLLPLCVFPYLDQTLDWDNELDQDLIEIAKHLVRWEERLVSPFRLSPADIHDIKANNQQSPELQRYKILYILV